MSEKRVRIEGDTPEAVAYALLLCIASNEDKAIVDGLVRADRKWLLDTYAECLRAAKEPGLRLDYPA